MNNINGFKADVFSLGLTLLTAGLLNDVTDVYNKGRDKIDDYKLKNYLNTFRMKY